MRQGHFWLFGGLGIDSTGTLGAAAAGTAPGARVDSVAWADSAGNFWIFGGLGFDSAGTVGQLNDLWKFSEGEWTWVSGSNIVNQLGVYGTQGVSSANNTPGARANPVSWTDASGTLWLFGGQGYDSTGVLCAKYEGSLPCNLNDLWKYSANEWMWVGGSNLVAQSGSYGTQGMPTATNIPGARWGAASRIDASGRFWLFGGNGFDSSANPQVYGDLNDLWTYDGTQWNWVSGSNHAGQSGVYGTLGAAAASNVPGARDGAVSPGDAARNGAPVSESSICSLRIAETYGHHRRDKMLDGAISPAEQCREDCCGAATIGNPRAPKPSAGGSGREGW